MNARQFLFDIYLNRKKKNTQYSLRAFAQFLELHPGRLSEFFSGKKKLPKDSIDRIVKKLKLSEQQQIEFLDSIRKMTKNDIHFLYVDPSELEKVWIWESFVIRRLIETKGFKNDPFWIAHRTGISIEKVRQTIDDLLVLNLVTQDGGKLKLTQVSLRTHDDQANDLIREFHTSTSKHLFSKIPKIDVPSRDVSTAFFCGNEKNLANAKKLIEKFRRDLIKTMSRGGDDDVYTLAIQLIPLTRTTKS